MHRFNHLSMQNALISIGEAAKLLRVSIDTLRRWDLSGKLISIRDSSHGHRYYRQSDVEHHLQNISTIAREWAESIHAVEPKTDIYCPTRDVFQARLEHFQSEFSNIAPLNTVSLITAIAGEIGNNSFDHNLGNWPDITGILFSYNLYDKYVILADRGQGILTTLKRVRPELNTAGEALKVAFTETVSGRYPEARGNGLKFVRSVIINNPFTLYFQTGDACLYLKANKKYVTTKSARTSIKGCFVTIGIEDLI
jgi:hypothetical protein